MREKQTVVDEKWRLEIPQEIVRREAINEATPLFLAESEDGCLKIYFRNPNAEFIELKPRLHKLWRGKFSAFRLTIPRTLRDSTSFYLGRKIILVDRGQSLELWPRP